MSLRFDGLSVDAKDPVTLARWWAELLGGTHDIDADDDPEVGVKTDGYPDLLFIRVPDDKVVKNRLHLDLRPDDQAAEVARAESMGATRVEIGQSDDPNTTWVVLADPEGNEFCILRAVPT